MNARFSGKLVIVAGGTGGLGRAVSLAFLEEGAKVVVTYRNEKEFDALRSAAGNSSSLEGHRVDVTDETAVRGLIDEVLVKHVKLDALVNSVGGYAGGVNLWETDPKLFDQMFALNMQSVYVLARAAVPVMLKQGHGSMVNIASKAAVGPRCRCSRLRCFQGSSCGNDGFAGGRAKGHGCAGELDSSQHHRHRNKPESNAQSRLCEVAEARGHSARNPILVQRRSKIDSWRSRAGVWHDYILDKSIGLHYAAPV